MNAHFDAWAADARRRGLAPRYIEQQRSRIEHLGAFAGGVPTQEQVRDWLTHLATEGMPRPDNGKQRPASPKTINNHLCSVRKYLAWCVKAGLIDHNPAEGVEWSKARESEGRALTGSQAWALFEAAQQDETAGRPRSRHRDGRVVIRSPVYRVLMATGMRIGAAQRLRVRDFEIHADPARIIIPAALDKSRRERQIIISETDRQYFSALLKGRDPGDIAFRRPHCRVLYRDGAAAGIPQKDERGRGLGWHCIRRWHGTEMDRQGFTLKQIQQRLGHTSIMTTQKYLVRHLDEQQEVAERLSAVQLKNSQKYVDAGDRIADTGNATNGSPQSHDLSENRGERPAPAVCRNSVGAGPPRSFDAHPSGVERPKGKSRQQEDPPSPFAPRHEETGSNPVTPIRGYGRDRLSLFHRMLDMLEGSDDPGTSPEVWHEPDAQESESPRARTRKPGRD